MFSIFVEATVPAAEFSYPSVYGSDMANSRDFTPTYTRAIVISSSKSVQAPSVPILLNSPLKLA